MKNRKLSITAFALALLIAASSMMTACSDDHGNGTDSDTNGFDTENKQIEQNLPTGDDGTDTAPPPVITPTTEPQTPETEPPVNDPVTDDPGANDPSNDDPSSDIPAVEMPETDPVTDESDVPVINVGALDAFIGQTDSGRFESVQSKNLVLFIDWESVIGEDGVADVEVTVGVSHYQLFSREKYNMGAIQVDGNAELFSTPAIAYDEAVKTQTVFYTAKYETARSEMEIEASWQVLGNYGGVDIDTLTVGGTIVFGE